MMRYVVTILAVILVQPIYGKITIINSFPEVSNFYKSAQRKSATEQRRIWEKLVEKKFQRIYTRMVYGKGWNSKWEKRRENILNNKLTDFLAKYSEIKPHFKNFKSDVKKQYQKFQKQLPSAKLDASIAALPSFGSFDAQLDMDGGQTVLVFGLDTMLRYNRFEDIDTFYSHELFHLYHFKQMKLSADHWGSKGCLSLFLWLEGMATYYSGLVNPGSSDRVILFDEKLGASCKEKYKKYAKLFITSASLKLNDPLKEKPRQIWFAGKRTNIKTDIPVRAGYCLGLETVRHLVKSNRFENLINWSPEIAHNKILEALQEMAKN